MGRQVGDWRFPAWSEITSHLENTMRRIAVIMSSLVVLLASVASARADEPDLSLQVLKYRNGRLEYQLGTNCEQLYPGKKVTLFLDGKRIGSLTIEEGGGESGMGLSPIRKLTVTSASVLDVETGVGTFSFRLDPPDLRKQASHFRWINGELKK
jgi:hypothetical protein